MELTFATNKLRKLCETQSLAVKKLGDVGARKLRARLSDLQVAATPLELVAGRPHQLKGSDYGSIALDLDGGRRIVFEPTHKPIPMKPDQSIDWKKVTEVRILYIGDYHD